MADLPISLMAAQPFTVPSSCTLIVTDSGAGSPRTVTFTSGRVARVYLATATTGVTPGLNGGTASDPDEWLRLLQRHLNNADALNLWSVTLLSSGKVKITYNGTGNGAIDWNGAGGTSLIPRYLTGFTDDIFLAAGASDTATYQPTHSVFCVSGRANSNGWQVRNKRAAIAETDDGLTAAFTASRAVRTYTSDWRFFPYDTTAKSALSANGTVYQPVSETRWTTTSATPSTSNSPPWSLVDFMTTVHGARCGVALGNFQEIVAGSDSSFFDVTLDRRTLQADDPVAPSAPDWSQRVDWRGVTLRYVAHKTR